MSFEAFDFIHECLLSEGSTSPLSPFSLCTSIFLYKSFLIQKTKQTFAYIRQFLLHIDFIANPTILCMTHLFLKTLKKSKLLLFNTGS